ncbi:MAG: LacI family DNA-binding transcriptional regulator [Opitutaceae bacterium]|jgi:LacI family transcriptional regulator/LacI family fructose operon transcriptional repressor
MEDVARLAGVHQTTVSRALRNDRRVSPEVRARVEAAAGKIGYRPNPLLAALGTMRRQRAATENQPTLAFIRQASPARGLVDGGHLPGARAAAAQRGYKLEEFVIDGDLHARRLDTILKTRNIQGAILGPLPEAHGYFQLDWTQFSTVVIEYSFIEPAFDRVVTDSYNTMRLALAECRHRGFSRLGLALAQVVDERNEGLLCAAYALAARRDPGLANIPPLILPSWNEKTFAAWLKRNHPEVIISSNTLLPQIEQYLRTEGIRIPTDVGVINLNVNPATQPHSGVCQDAHAIGAQAARLVIEKLNHNDRGVPASRMTILTDGRWHDGKTMLAEKPGQHAGKM